MRGVEKESRVCSSRVAGPHCSRQTSERYAGLAPPLRALWLHGKSGSVEARPPKTKRLSYGV